MAELYADENFDDDVADLLRQHGHDVLTAHQASQRGIPDRDVLAFAISVGRAVLTLNRRHFVRLHKQVKPHRGIIVCTSDNDKAALAKRIDEALAACPVLDNQLIRVNRPR
jgi:hypothetical protein